MCTNQLDRDKQAETQAFFANMTDKQIAGEYLADIKQIGRWHDAVNGSGVIIVDAVRILVCVLIYFLNRFSYKKHS